MSHINNGRNVGALLAALAFVIGVVVTPDAFGQHRRHHGHAPVVPQVVSATSPGVQTAIVCALRPRDVSRTRRGGARALRRRNYPLCITNYAVVVSANCAEAADRYNLSFCYGANGQLRESLEELRWLQTHNQRPEDVTSEELTEAITNLEARLPRQPTTATSPVEPPTQTPTVACTAGHVDCYGTCRDLATDASDCGACGVVCPLGQTCQRGACQPPVLQRVVDVRQPPRQTPVTPHQPSSAGGVALITGGAAVAAAGAVILTLGFINQNQDEGDGMRLAMNGCGSAMNNSSTCVRYPEGATLPGDLAAWQIPVGATALGVGIASTVVGVILVTRHGDQRPSQPRARPTASLVPGGFALGFTGTF